MRKPNYCLALITLFSHPILSDVGECKEYSVAPLEDLDSPRVTSICYSKDGVVISSSGIAKDGNRSSEQHENNVRDAKPSNEASQFSDLTQDSSSSRKNAPSSGKNSPDKIEKYGTGNENAGVNYSPWSWLWAWLAAH